MPIPGHDYGVDSGLTLKGLNWADIHPQRTADPVFAGRYFNPHVSVTWVDGETIGLKQANPALAYVFPMQSPGQSPFNRVQGLDPNGTKADSATVQSWGDADATATCKRIWEVVKSKQLDFPSSKSVIVYLDIEAGVNLSSHYWYGWASRVYWFGTGFFQWPFYPGLYCTTMHNPGAPPSRVPNQAWRWHHIPSGPKALAAPILTTGSKTVTPSPNMRGISANTYLVVDFCTPSEETVQAISVTKTTFTANFTKTHAAGATLSTGEVQTGLTAAPNNLASRCYGIYASNPEDDDSGFPVPANPASWPPTPPGKPNHNARFRPNFFPDWGTAPDVRFDTWRQTVHVIFGLIPLPIDVRVFMWQYGSQSLPPSTDPSPPAFNALHIDLDETSPNGEAIGWMMTVP